MNELKPLCSTKINTALDPVRPTPQNPLTFTRTDDLHLIPRHSFRYAMAEGTYEYECERAELLGIDKPDYDEFMQRKRAQEATAVEEEEVDVENLKV